MSRTIVLAVIFYSILFVDISGLSCWPQDMTGNYWFGVGNQLGVINVAHLATDGMNVSQDQSNDIIGGLSWVWCNCFQPNDLSMFLIAENVANSSNVVCIRASMDQLIMVVLQFSEDDSRSCNDRATSCVKSTYGDAIFLPKLTGVYAAIGTSPYNSCDLQRFQGLYTVTVKLNGTDPVYCVGRSTSTATILGSTTVIQSCSISALDASYKNLVSGDNLTCVSKINQTTAYGIAPTSSDYYMAVFMSNGSSVKYYCAMIALNATTNQLFIVFDVTLMGPLNCRPLYNSYMTAADNKLILISSTLSPMSCAPIDRRFCHNRGTCNLHILGIWCKCPFGYTGRQCDSTPPAQMAVANVEPISACNPTPCMNYGLCAIVNIFDYICTCQEDFFGGNCELNRGDQLILIIASITQPTFTTPLTTITTTAVGVRPTFVTPKVLQKKTTTTPATTTVSALYPQAYSPYTHYYPYVFKATICEIKPCKNSGMCLPKGLLMFTCNCPSAFKGRTCESSVASVVFKLVEMADLSNSAPNAIQAAQVMASTHQISTKSKNVVIVVVGITSFLVLSSIIACVVVRRHEKRQEEKAKRQLIWKLGNRVVGPTVQRRRQPQSDFTSSKYHPLPPDFRIPRRHTARYRAMKATGLMSQVQYEAAAQNTLPRKYLLPLPPLTKAIIYNKNQTFLEGRTSEVIQDNN